MPYLLLAGFYFFGFAFGMFSNQQTEPSVHNLAPIVIHVDAQQKNRHHELNDTKVNHNFYQNYKSELVSKENRTAFFSLLGSSPGYRPDHPPGRYEYNFSTDLFSRPPPMA